MRTEHEGGFSLIELMVAMVVTLMVTGAIYGLLSGGQSSFRKEPELTDRQQNIRLAMDVIMRDIESAGSGMPSFIQTFTTGLDGASLASCRDNSGSTVTCPVAPSGARTDELEIMANPNNAAPEDACYYPGSGANVRLLSSRTNVAANQVVMILLNNGTWTMRNINGGVNTTSGNPSTGRPPNGEERCSTDPHMNIQFTPGSDSTGFNVPGGLCAGNRVMNGTVCVGCSDVPGTACCNTNNNDCDPKDILAGEIIRYRIRVGPDLVPNLERFSSGTSSNFSTGGVPQFQVIARGVEDLQVRYIAACDPVATPCPPTDNAPVVDSTRVNYGSLTQSVSVTLSARSEARNVTGVQTAPSGPAALRGSLTSVGSPRATLYVLGTPAAQRASGWAGPSPWN